MTYYWHAVVGGRSDDWMINPKQLIWATSSLLALQRMVVHLALSKHGVPGFFPSGHFSLEWLEPVDIGDRPMPKSNFWRHTQLASVWTWLQCASVDRATNMFTCPISLCSQTSTKKNSNKALTIQRYLLWRSIGICCTVLRGAGPSTWILFIQISMTTTNEELSVRKVQLKSEKRIKFWFCYYVLTDLCLSTETKTLSCVLTG